MSKKNKNQPADTQDNLLEAVDFLSGKLNLDLDLEHLDVREDDVVIYALRDKDGLDHIVGTALDIVELAMNTEPEAEAPEEASDDIAVDMTKYVKFYKGNSYEIKDGVVEIYGKDGKKKASGSLADFDAHMDQVKASKEAQKKRSKKTLTYCVKAGARYGNFCEEKEADIVVKIKRGSFNYKGDMLDQLKKLIQDIQTDKGSE